MNDMFTGHGPSEDDARDSDTVPAALEVVPGSYKPLQDCSREEVESTMMSLMMQAESLLHQAKSLGRYLERRGG